MKLIVSRAAVADLARVRTFLADKNEIAAHGIQVLEEAMQSLLHFPHRGRQLAGSERAISSSHLESPPIWCATSTAEADEIIVLRLWHGRELRE